MGADIYAPGFEWNPKQKAIIEAISRDPMIRHVGLWGGGRSGKSFLNTSITKIRAAKAPDSNHLIGRSSYSAVKRSIRHQTWPDVEKLVMPDFKGKWYDRDGFIAYPNQSKIWLGGYDKKERVDKVLGNEYSTIQHEETSELNFNEIETLRGRLAENVMSINGKPLRQLELNSLNPTHNKHWSYLEFIRGLNPESLERLDRSIYYQMQVNPLDNKKNLSEGFLASLAALSPLKRKRFLDGEYNADNDNALMHLYVLSDGSCGGRAPVRFEALVNEHDIWHSDVVIGETNFGGDMVEKAVRDTAEIMNNRGKRSHSEIAYKPVVASKGKVLRAEPVSNLYYQERVHHVGPFVALEDEMCQFTTDWNRRRNGSPNRVDALVFAITDLMGNSEPVENTYRPEVEFVDL